MVNDRRRRGGRGNSSVTGSGSGSGGRVNEQQADTPPPSSEAGTKVVDLNSRSDTFIASIVFLPAQQHNFPIIQFECHDCLVACQQIHHWMQTTGPPEIQPFIRAVDQKLNLIGPHTKGRIFFLEGAATLEGAPSKPISLFAMQIPKDRNIRYFWTPLSPSLLLTELATHDLIGPPIIDADERQLVHLPSGAILPPRHHTLYTFLTQSFEFDRKYPDSPEYRKASQMSDVCPSILDQKTALRRIQATDNLYISHNGKDLGDDRYILELHPAERELASLLFASCAEYLLFKRQYFKLFSRETVAAAAKVRRAAANPQRLNRSAPLGGTGQNHVKEDEEDEDDDNDDNDDDEEKDAEHETEDDESPADTPTPRATPMATRSRARSDSATPALRNQRATDLLAARSGAARAGARNRALRVRTENKHIRTVEGQAAGWTYQRAKKLIIGWNVLGFLDEKRVLAVQEGEDDVGWSEGDESESE